MKLTKVMSSRGVLFYAAIGIILLCFGVLWLVDELTTPAGPTQKVVTRIDIVVDPDTGCEYVKLNNVLSPRMRGDGSTKQICNPLTK